MTEDREALRERITEAFNTAYEPLGEGGDKSFRHDGHQFFGACFVCRGDVPQLVDRVMPVVDELRAEIESFAAMLLDRDKFNAELIGQLATTREELAKAYRLADALRAAVGPVSSVSPETGGTADPGDHRRRCFDCGELVGNSDSTTQLRVGHIQVVHIACSRTALAPSVALEKP